MEKKEQRKKLLAKKCCMNDLWENFFCFLIILAGVFVAHAWESVHVNILVSDV